MAQRATDELDPAAAAPLLTGRRAHWSRAILSVQAVVLCASAAFLWGGGAQWIMPMIATCVGVATIVVALSWPLHPSLMRRLGLGLGGGTLPLLAVLIGTGAPAALAVLGLGVAGGVLGLLRPRFTRLRPRARKTWLVLHVGFSVSWLGAAMAMLVLALVAALTSDQQLRHYTYEIMHIFDLAIVIPLVLLSLVTGLVVSLGTKWGLVNYRWVLAKFVIALAIPVFAAIEESSWVRQARQLTERNRAADLAGTDVKLWVCFVVFSALLWSATALSTTKPWGKTRWGRTAQAETRTRRAMATDTPATSGTTVASGGVR